MEKSNMRILLILLLSWPVLLFAQGKVGVGTNDPDHPFQVNVDSIWQDTVIDLSLEGAIGFSTGYAIQPGTQKLSQSITIGQSGYLEKVVFFFAFPTVTDVLVINVHNGAGPEGVLLKSDTLYNVTIGSDTAYFEDPKPFVTSGQVINIVMKPLTGVSCKWRYSFVDYVDGSAQLYAGSWTPLELDMACRTFVAFADTVVHQVLNVRDDRKVMINDYALPRYDGNAGDLLKSDGSGDLVWAQLNTLGLNMLQDSDMDTKIQVEANPDEDIIRMSTAGSERMTILNSGNVGIGTTSPGNRLRINGSTSSSQHVFSAGTNYAGNVQIRAVEGFSTPGIGYGIGGYFIGGSRGVQSYGNGGALDGLVIGVEGSATGTAGTRTGIFGRATGGATNWAGYFAEGNVKVENSIEIDGKFVLGATGIQPARFYVRGPSDNTDAVARFGTSYTGTHNIHTLIAYSSPSPGYGVGGYFIGGQSGVKGEAFSSNVATMIKGVEGIAYGSGGPRYGVFGTANGGTENWAGYFDLGNVFVNNKLSVNADAPVSDFTVHGAENDGTNASVEIKSTSGAQRLIMDGNEVDVIGGTLFLNSNSGGRVAINTNDAANGYALSVGGKIISEEVRVQLAADWPDYVFKADYPMKTLPEVAQFIQEKGHLPGIPSAEDVHRDGHHIGDMQIRLLAKIEELTLHLIALEKQNQQLVERLEVMEASTKINKQ